jgi:type III secretion protein J
MPVWLVAPLRWSILALIVLVAGCGKVDLYSNLNERQANEMLALLMRAGISAEKQPIKDGLLRLAVDRNQFADAVELLTRNGYPRTTFNSIGEVFQREGLISSPLEERVRFVYALSQELSTTISEIDGVLSARVHVVLPTDSFSNANARPSSAAIFIRHQENAPLDLLGPEIKRLVEKSIEGLSYENVELVMVPVDPGVLTDTREGYVRAASLYIHPGSLNEFWVIFSSLGALALLSLAGNGVLFWLWWRQSREPMAAASAVGDAD